MRGILHEILEVTADFEEADDGELQSDASADGLGLYRCWRPQEIRNLLLPEASVLLVLRGQKQLATTSRSWQVGPGEVLLVPADTTFALGNYPDASGQPYRGLAIRFSPQVISHFRQLYGAPLQTGGPSDRWSARAPAEFLRAIRQWLRWCRESGANSLMARHRRVELLLLLAQAQLAGNILLPHHPSWSRRVSGLLHVDPAHAWRMEDVGSRLGVSESTLRRHLQEEGKGFRELLEEVRLAHGLTMIQESQWPIGRIADAVGYRSPSRFSERFKRRFGMTPRDLRHTQAPDLPVSTYPA